MEKERSVDYAGHRIRVVANSEGARLFVDNELLDVTNDLYASEEEATLVGVFGEEGTFREFINRDRSVGVADTSLDGRSASIETRHRPQGTWASRGNTCLSGLRSPNVGRASDSSRNRDSTMP
jgi:hypothetical protein